MDRSLADSPWLVQVVEGSAFSAFSLVFSSKSRRAGLSPTMGDPLDRYRAAT